MLMITPAKTLLILLTGFLAGLATASNFLVPIFPLVYFVLLIILLLLTKNVSPIFFSLVFIVTFFAGTNYASQYRQEFYLKQAPIQKNAHYKKRGVIVSEPEIKGRTQRFLIRETEQNTNIQVATNQFPSYKYGQQVDITGRLESKRSTYNLLNKISYNSFYPNIEVVSTEPPRGEYFVRIRGRLIGIKNNLVIRIERYLPEPAAGLVNGVLFGTRAGLSEEMIALLVASGTIHIIALSGYNITLIVDFFKKALTPMGRNLGFYGATIGILIFILSTGLSASVVRAAIMGWLWLLARYLGRQNEAIIPILFSAVLMSLVNPFLVSFDVGFQLSFAALLGLIYLAPILNGIFKIFGPSFSEIISTSVAASLTTWPILATNFGQFSVIAPISNVFILPFVPLLMLLGIVLPILSLVCESLAQIFANLPWLLAQYFFSVINYFGTLKTAQITQKINSSLIILGYYALLFELYLFKGRAHVKRKII